MIPISAPPSCGRGGNRGQSSDKTQEPASFHEQIVERLDASAKAMDKHRTEAKKDFETLVADNREFGDDVRADMDNRFQQMTYEWYNTSGADEFYAGVGKD